MFDNFIKYFDINVSPSTANNPLENFRMMFAGQSFNDGLFRVLKNEDIDIWREKISLAFPKFTNKFEPFAFDWLGRFYCIKIDQETQEVTPEIYFFNIGHNQNLLIPVNLTEFLNEEIPEHSNASLDIENFNNWRNENPAIAYEDCVGYINPLFEGGEDNFGNMQVINMIEYWDLFTNIIKSAPYSDRLLDHYEYFFDIDYTGIRLDLDILEELDEEFCILKFPPTEQREVWAYATLCMSNDDDIAPIELYMYSATENDTIIEILTNIAYFHKTESTLEETHVIEFCQPWHEESDCKYGLICPPYIDGPEFEECGNISCYWLLPITKQEAEYRVEFGMDELEEKFASDEFDFLDYNRNSMI